MLGPTNLIEDAQQISVKTAMATAVRLAGLSTEHGNVTPHTLRHTAATWLMQNGVPLWEAAGFLGMSEKTLRETYGHHHPDFMRGAVEAIGRKPVRPEKWLKRWLMGTASVGLPGSS